ncbi:cell division protein ZapA [Methylibium petroleiphilum]|uniref:cell division protein ZapA n=1 Tax=Methylibium petroleiphilum TaxID=105560 RepID=UPI001AD086D9|nr:cell division protein ZapA [Methylibium petroleiphilum]MBN9206276.1 cell division protein ZapA [Methylibium petroleiphilum]
MKQLEVTIMGQSYILGCPDGGERALLEAVGNVDQEMCAIRDAGKVRARERIAVLAALNLAYQLAERPLAAATPARSAGQAAPDPAHGVDLEALIGRIDETLGRDGQLL